MATKKRPNNIETRSELIHYISIHPEEPPFNEELFEKAQQETANINFDIISKNARNKKKKKLECVGNVYFKLVGDIETEQEKIEEKTFDVLDLLDLENESDAIIADLMDNYFSYITKEEDLIYIINRLKDYYSEYDINNGSDKFLVVTVVSMELELNYLYKDLNSCTSVSSYSANLKNIDLLNKSLKENLSSLNALKKQEDKNKGDSNCFTEWVKSLMKDENFKVKEIPIEKDEIDYIIEASEECIKKTLLS